MDDRVPVTEAAAALRIVRRASWGQASLVDVSRARAALTDPMGRMAVAWLEFCTTHDDYVSRPSADRWDLLRDALTRFDEATAVFFGPSGAETRDRP